MSNVKRISELSTQDEAIARIIYAKDCICNGNLPVALKALDFALLRLKKDNAFFVDNEVVRLLQGD